MTTYLLLDIDDTIAPTMYRGSDAVYIDTWGRGHLAIPKYIVEWLKRFSKTENKSIWWCTDRASETTQIERQLPLKVNGKLRFTKPPEGVWKKQASILQFAAKHPDDVIICVDNDADLMTTTNIPDNLYIIIPTGAIKALSKDDLVTIDQL